MRIDPIEHADLVCGALEVEEAAEGVRCSRFNATALELLENAREEADATAGIRVSLVTDSSHVMMRLQRDADTDTEPEPYQVDVLVDRAECHTYESDEDVGDFFFSLELEEDEEFGDHEIEIFLPHNTQVHIKELELDDGALFRPLYPGDDRMLFLGDGLVQGYGATSPFRSMVSLLATELRSDFLNWGLTGVPLNSDLGRAALEAEWQTAIIAAGISDYRMGCAADDFAAELATMLDLLSTRSGVKLRMLSPVILPEVEGIANEAGCTLDDFRRAISRVAGEMPHVTLIHGQDALSKGRKLYAPGESFFLSDKGMASVADHLYRQLMPGSAAL